STLTCQNFNFGGGSTTCSIFDPNNGMTYSNGANTPNNLSLGSYAFTWVFPTAVTGNFNIAWSSFSGSGYTGCIAGSPTCSPTPSPEPSTLSLLAAGLFGLAATGFGRAKAAA
ncbi:MAG: PEP-CTERM sorting domain-containing protein, partial [Acidobacteriota bacterium]|nr:PEP-CTERM sorting domain-containing protein [Acidobacteriota bacterium]